MIDSAPSGAGAVATAGHEGGAGKSETAGGIPLWPWGLLGLVTMPLLLAGMLVWYETRGGILFGDIDWYATGLRGLLSDGPLYDPSKLLPHPLDRPPFWDQAPSTALLTLLVLPGDGWVWGFTMFSATAVGLALIWPRVGPGGVVLLAPVLILWLPVTSAFFWANVNALVFCLLAVAWRFPRAAGIAIGVAAAIKLVPILAVGWLAGKRDWRGLAWATAIPLVATGIVLVWKGPETLSDFIVLRLSQWTPERPFRWGLADAGLSPVIGYGVAFCVAALAWWRVSFSLAVVAMLISIPALHAHYWTWLLVPLIGIWLPWLIRRSRGRFAVPVPAGPADTAAST